MLGDYGNVNLTYVWRDEQRNENGYRNKKGWTIGSARSITDIVSNIIQKIRLVILFLLALEQTQTDTEFNIIYSIDRLMNEYKFEINRFGICHWKNIETEILFLWDYNLSFFFAVTILLQFLLLNIEDHCRTYYLIK